MVQGWPSPTFQLLRENKTALNGHLITKEEESWIGSLPFLGAFTAASLYNYINRNMGCKITGYLTAVPLVYGYLLIIFGTSITYICIARFFIGFSLSGINVLVTLYMAEILEDNTRKAAGNLRSIAENVGLILIYALGSYLTILHTTIVCISIPVFFLFTFFLLPESPIFLLRKGKPQAALNAYLWLRGGDRQLAEEEMKKLRAVIDARESTEHCTVGELLSECGTRKALQIIIILSVVQQLSGINVIFTFCETIFRMSGSSLSPEWSSLIVSFFGLFGSIFSRFFFILSGRRFILVSTQTLQGVSLGGFGVYLYLRHIEVNVSNMGVLPVIFISIYIFCVIAGVANLLHVVISEMIKSEAQEVAMKICGLLSWALAFLSIKFYYSLIDILDLHGCIWLFASVSFTGAISMYLLLPETKNKSLELIMRKLNDEPPQEDKSRNI
ncbi:facilitated trehalose transporter Tret1-like isoform X2 [Periplaneta americana]